MPNPYTSQYMPTGFENADQQGLAPVFQNIGSQQQYLNQQLSQGGQMAQPTSQGTNLSGLNPMAMAAMLRNKQPQSNADAAKMNEFGAYMPWTQISTADKYGTNPYSQQSLMLASQDLGMK